MKKAKRKKILKEVEFSRGQREEIPAGLLGPPAPPASQTRRNVVIPSPAQVAASAVRSAARTEDPLIELLRVTRKVAKQLSAPEKDIYRSLKDLMEKEKLKADAAAEKIIAAYKRETEAVLPAPEEKPETASTTPEEKQLENLKSYTSMDDLVKDFTKAGFPYLAKYADIQLRNEFAKLIRGNQEIKTLDDKLDKLEKERDNIIVTNKGFKRRNSEEYYFPNVSEEDSKEIIKNIKKIENQIVAIDKELNDKNTSLLNTLPNILFYQRIKNRDKNAVKDFVDSLTDSLPKTKKEESSFEEEKQIEDTETGIGLKANVLFDLQDNNLLSKGKVQEIIADLKAKKLLENKRRIKLADILF